MLNKSIIRNKKNNGNEVVYFESIIESERNELLNENLVFRYYKLNPITWRVELVTQPHEQLPYRLFSEVFQLPNESVPLTVVCGLGMMAIKDIFSTEVQYYSNIQLTLAEEIGKIANQSSRS